MNKIIITTAISAFVCLTNVFSQDTYQKGYVQNHDNQSYAADMVVCSDGGVIMTSTVSANGMGLDTLILTKTFLNGQVEWAKQIVTDITSYNPFPSVVQKSNGDFCIMCVASDLISYQVISVSPNGNINWSKKYSYGTIDMYAPPRMHPGPNGTLMIAFSEFTRMSLLKLDNSGNITWAGAYATSSNEPKDPGFDATECSDGGYMATAKSGSDLFIVKLDAAGNLQWGKSFQNWTYTRAYSIAQANDGNNIISGLVQTTNNEWAFMMKIDNDGNVIWYKTYGGGAIGSFNQMVLMANGYIALLTHDYTNYLPVIVVTDQNGNVLFSKNIGSGMGNLWATNIGRTPGDDIYFGCSGGLSTSSYSIPMIFKSSWMNMDWCDASDFTVTQSNVTFNPGTVSTSVASLTPFSFAGDAPVSSVSISMNAVDYCLSSSVVENTLSEQINVFPNPISTSATIQVDAALINENTQFILFDMLGKEVMKVKITSEKTQIDRGSLNAGIYLYKIDSGSAMIKTGKLVIADN